MSMRFLDTLPLSGVQRHDVKDKFQLSGQKSWNMADEEVTGAKEPCRSATMSSSACLVQSSRRLWLGSETEGKGSAPL